MELDPKNDAEVFLDAQRYAFWKPWLERRLGELAPYEAGLVDAAMALRMVPYAARKVGGSYEATGTVISSFKTLAGEERVVFEFDMIPGMLHIFNPNQLVPLE